MKRITVIGGGASGTLLAINLLKYDGDERIEINLVEKRDTIGRGVAFGTKHDVHLLNVPAGKMSAFPDDPEHFHRWLLANGHETDSHDFVPRMLFGKYLTETLEEARDQAKANVILNIFDDEAVDAHFETGKAEVVFASGDIHYSEAVVLAFGNFLPPHPSVSDKAFTKAAKYFLDPWSPDVDTAIEKEDAVLILGTGLSMADAVLRLRNNGHTGMISAISTRGLISAEHKLGYTHPSFYDEIKDKQRITDILKIVRREMQVAADKGSDWRAVIDSLRPNTQELWLNLPLAEKKYFMQHLSRYWNVARHRMPPQVRATLEEMRSAGTLSILRGRLRSIEYTPDGFVTSHTFNGETKTIGTDAIINCIASESNFSKIDSPLVKNLFASGSIRCDDLNFGLDAAPDGTVRFANGDPNGLVFTLGTALKGVLWESTAIPEIRVQAQNLARRLTQP